MAETENPVSMSVLDGADSNIAGCEDGILNTTTNNVQANGISAAEFLASLFKHTTQPVYLCSLANVKNDPNTGPEKRIMTRDDAEIATFVTKNNDPLRATYFCVGTVEGWKRNKDFVRELPALWADIDFKDTDEKPADILRKVKAMRLPPSMIVASGHGYHCYWTFREPVLAVEIQRVEAAAKLLADLVAGDMQVTQIAALMRVPGSNNTKDPNDRRTVTIADNGGYTYEFDDIEEMLSETSPFILRKAREKEHTVKESNFFTEYGTRTGYTPPLDVKKRLGNMMFMGSGDAAIHITQLQVTASMLNDGIELEQVVSLVLEATKIAAGTYGARWNWKREEQTIRGMCATWLKKLAKEVKDGKTKASKTAPADDIDPVETADDHDLKRLNAIHAVLPIGGKVRVVTFGELDEFPGRETIVMTQSITDFAALQNKYRHKYLDKKNEVQSIPMGSYWIGSQYRRQYDGGMAFMPRHNKDSKGNKLNLWRGHGVQIIKPNDTTGAAGCDLFLSFMCEVICNGNEADFDYLRKREATILQKRIRTEIALGLRSDGEGVGKGFYEKVMSHLLGVHAMQVGNPKHVIGAFNPHLETLLRLTADEALFVGNPEHRNALFGLITEPNLTIEPKGCGVYRADNYLNLSVISNAKHFVPISGTARRFFLPTVSQIHMQDIAYFAAIQHQLDNGGYEALLYHFMHEVDLTGFNVRLVPKTDGLMEQRNHSLHPMEAWWCELLESGTIAGADPSNPSRAVSNEYQREVEIDLLNGVTQTRFVKQLGIFDQARQLEPRLRMHISDHRLGTHLSDMGCTNKKKVLRRRGWQFPPLMVCRAEWEKHFPGWPWRDTDITEWRAEDADDVPERSTLTPEENMKATAEAAAKAYEHAEQLSKVADLAKINAKFR